MSKDTLQLPKTAFSMKASLPLKEPEILKRWEKNKIFDAASITSVSTNLIPKSVSLTNGGTAYINVAIIAGTAPKPNNIIPGIK